MESDTEETEDTDDDSMESAEAAEENTPTQTPEKEEIQPEDLNKGNVNDGCEGIPKQTSNDNAPGQTCQEQLMTQTDTGLVSNKEGLSGQKNAAEHEYKNDAGNELDDDELMDGGGEDKVDIEAPTFSLNLT